MIVQAHLTQSVIDPINVESDFSKLSGMAGAVVTFKGVMRPKTKQGELLDRLILEWHPRMTERSLQKIGEDGRKRFDVNHIKIIHRCGPILPGEIIVFVGVSSDHRREAFQAADYMMDRLKMEAVFWKKEEGCFGSRWIEPTVRDQEDRKRWSD